MQEAGRKLYLTKCIWMGLLACANLSVAPSVSASSSTFPSAAAPQKPSQRKGPSVQSRIAEASSFIRAEQARQTFDVNGQGLSVAILDTGIRSTHADFSGRILLQRNLTVDNGANSDNASDGHGHGTHVAGIIAAQGDHVGIAPGASIIPIKVISNNGNASFKTVATALQWVLDNHKKYNISVVNLSLGDGANYLNRDSDLIQERFQALREARIAVVTAAGNNYYLYRGFQGMTYPAIFPETVSVGAVYDADVGPLTYNSGAKAHSTGAGRLTPFSQRLSEATGGEYRTDIFAPGAPITSSGILDDHSEAVQSGTSQAAPVTAGVILLMQQHYLRTNNRLPTVSQLEDWLRSGGVAIKDGDDEDDNAKNSGEAYFRIDALGALQAMGLTSPKGFDSPPSASPSPASVNESVTFSSHFVGDEDTQISWDFGDGTHANGAEAQHAYAVAGTYSVSVKVHFQDGESFSHVLKVTIEAVEPISLTSLNMRTKRTRSGHDQLTVAGALYWPDGVYPSGLTVNLDVAGAIQTFTLDERGRAKYSQGALMIRMISARTPFHAGGQATFKCRLKGGDWSGAWAATGLKDKTVKKVQVTIPVRIELGQKIYEGNIQATYSARKGKSGCAKSVR